VYHSTLGSRVVKKKKKKIMPEEAFNIKKR